MKHLFLILLTFMSVLLSNASSCNKEDNSNKIENNPMATGKIKITVNSQTFTATLLDNNSAKAFKEMLPLTINMTELNGNEKYYDLPNILPTNSSNPATIKNGDLMLYGSKTLVLFYKSFSTSYSYTKLGTIDDKTGLASALGSGDITVSLELK
ncbi:MAG: cyclophilin-like fold protein [Microscillaceae bacterium]|nr:cyclophilin-like fold protein [Microscillaceae bacterium]